MCPPYDECSCDDSDDSYTPGDDSFEDTDDEGHTEDWSSEEVEERDLQRNNGLNRQFE